MLQLSCMAKKKKRPTPAQKEAKKKRKLEYETIFINGKQKRVKKAAAIDGMDGEEFIRRNADPIWLHQNDMWECLDDMFLSDDEPVSFEDEFSDTEFDLKDGDIPW